MSDKPVVPPEAPLIRTWTDMREITLSALDQALKANPANSMVVIFQAVEEGDNGAPYSVTLGRLREMVATDNHVAMVWVHHFYDQQIVGFMNQVLTDVARQRAKVKPSLVKP